MAWTNPALLSLFWPTFIWSGITIALYIAAKRFHRLSPQWWNTPLAVTPALLIAITILSQTSYHEYIRSTHWLFLFLGPATVAFAIPIYEQRAQIRRHWPILMIGAVIGSSAAIASAWELSSLLGLDGRLRLSLLPRSISTPFAMTVADDIGGIRELTALFVVITGVFGAILGEIILKHLPLRSILARGALFGMGAHAAGVAKAHQLNREEGSIAGLMMILVGLLNVLSAPILAFVVK